MSPIVNCPDPSLWLRRIELNISPNGECWEWTRRLDPWGYGKFSFQENGKTRTTGAHRASWLAHVGDIPESYLQIDHLCRNRACVNPWHMDLVTNRVNSQRAVHPPGQGRPRNSTPSPCKIHGRDDGYVRTDKRGYRAWICRPCAKERRVRWKLRQLQVG